MYSLSYSHKTVGKKTVHGQTKQNKMHETLKNCRSGRANQPTQFLLKDSEWWRGQESQQGHELAFFSISLFQTFPTNVDTDLQI